MNFRKCMSVLKTDAERRNPITNVTLCAVQVFSIVAIIVLFPDVLRSFDFFEDNPQWILAVDAYGDGFIPAWLAAISVAVCNLLTLKWRKSGMFLMIVSFLFICIPLALNEYIELVTFLGIMYGGLLIYWLILRLKKNGVSVWSQCSGCYWIANCVAVSIALFLIGLLPPAVGYTIGFRGDLYCKGCHYLDAHLTSSYVYKYQMGKDIAFSSLWRKEEWSRKSDAEYWFQSAMYSAKNNSDNKSALARVYAGHISFLLKVGDSEKAKQKYLEALEYVGKEDLRKMIAADYILKEYLADYDEFRGNAKDMDKKMNESYHDSISRHSSDYQEPSHYEPQPHTVYDEVWFPCITCHGDGKCTNCNGRGGYYIGNYYNVCSGCNGTGCCPWCGGRGQQMETRPRIIYY